MDNTNVSLRNYILAIKGISGELQITEKIEKDESFLDNGVFISSTNTIYYFNDGSVISCLIENDAFQNDAACGDIWISYEVNVGDNITPTIKNFTNLCQEQFWLKITSD